VSRRCNGRHVYAMEFHVEEVGGRPRAVFEDEGPLRGSLLSYFLHPAPYFVPDMLYELTMVERNSVESSGFDTPYVDVTFHRDRVVIEQFLAEGEEGEPPRVTISLDEAKLLLLEWGVALQRRKVERGRPL